MTMTTEHSAALIDEVIALLDKHRDLTVADVRQAIFDGTETRVHLVES